MRTTLGLWMVLMLLPALALAGETVASGTVTVASLEAAGEDVLRLTLTDLGLGAGAVLLRAQVELQASLADGSEVQLWRVASLEAVPWDEGGEGRGELLDLWITDERTGDTVVLDLTRYLRATLATEDTASLVVRVLGPDMETVALGVEDVTGAVLRVRMRAPAEEE